MNNLYSIIYETPFFQEFLNTIDDALYIMDSETRYVFINQQAADLDGYTLEDVKGKTLSEIYGDNYISPLRIVLKTRKKLEGFAYRYPGNGRNIYQICNAYPIIIDGEIEGAYAFHYNITRLKEMIEENIDLQQAIYSMPKDRFYSQDSISGNNFRGIVGESKSLLSVIRQAENASKNDSDILLTGATGTGKELFARGIHNSSKRRLKPFITINCSAIPETLIESFLFGTSKGSYTDAVERPGLFEQANHGTLFLDEINSMPLTSQAKLLRVLEDKKVTRLGSTKSIDVDVRIISSINVSSKELLEKKIMRSDLFYRLAVVNIVIPALTDRGNDMFVLTDHFIQLYNNKFDKQIINIDVDVREFFASYEWPGNVRQLKNCIESAMNNVSETALTLHFEDLPTYIREGYDIRDVISSPISLPPEIQKNEREVKDDSDSKRESEPIPVLEDQEEGKPDRAVDGEDVFEKIASLEKKKIIDKLVENNGNVSKTARDLDMHRQSLIYKMKKYGIHRSRK